MDATLRSRLLALNPWFERPAAFAAELAARLPPQLVPRQVDLADIAEPGNARLIVGPRQAGKSTLVWKALAGVDPQGVLFLNAEEPLVQRWCVSAAQFLADLRESLPSVRTVFLDEAQHLAEAGLFVKGLVDARRGLQLYVTGSSSFHLAARTRESLAGRAERFVVLPFSLGEVAGFESPASPLARAAHTARAAERMLVWGGYPRVWLGAEPHRVLSNLLEAFVLRDASDRFALTRPDALRKLLQLAAGQVGQLVNFAEWATLCGVAASTVRDYVAILEECWVLKLLPAFAGGRRREITTAPRVHFYDPGLRNALLDGLGAAVESRTDRGALFEALAFAELAKTVPRDGVLHYWRAKGGAEVDFVLTRGERCLAVEVEAGRAAGLTRSARSFIEAYAPEAFFVVAGIDDPGLPPETIGRTTVIRVGLVGLAGAVRAELAGPHGEG